MDLKELKTIEECVEVAYAQSRQGGRSENQDNYGYADTPFGFLVTVCDGMGGGPGGKTASSIAVETILESVKSANEEETTSNILIKAIRAANLAIIKEGNEKPELKGMGSTATVLLINNDSAHVAHVGDSRIYQLRGNKKVFRTFDHSMVFELVKQNVITEEQARLSAQSNVITRALGIKPDVEVDVEELSYQKKDRFMLTTDGIHGSLPEPELITLVSENNALGAITDSIATKIDDIGRQTGGGHDNLTIALIQTSKNSTKQPSISMKTKITIGALALIAVVSIVFNVIQMNNCEKSCDQTLAVDTVKIQDEVHQQYAAEISKFADWVEETDFSTIPSIETGKKIKTKFEPLQNIRKQNN